MGPVVFGVKDYKPKTCCFFLYSGIGLYNFPKHSKIKLSKQ